MQLKTIGESANVTKVIEQVINANNHLGKGLNDNIVLGQKLANATSSYSVEAVKTAISQSSLNKEQIKAILSQQGLTDEILETTTAELAQVTSTNALAASQEKATGTTLGFGNAMKGAGTALKSFASAHKLSLTIAGVAIALSLISKITKKFSEENEKLDNKIEKTTKSFSKATTKIDEINTKLEENKKRINEINKLKKPTYVDEQDLKNLKEQNKLLEKERKLLEASKQKNAESKNKALAEKFRREYTSNDARNEDLTKSDDAIDIISFKGLRGAVKAFTDTDTKDDKLSKSLITAQSLFNISKLSEAELTKYNDLITKRLAYEYNPNSKGTEEFKQLNDAIEAMGISIEDALTIGSVNSIIDLQKKVETNNESLEKERTDLLNRLSEYDETDPNYESEGAQEILRRLNEIYKYTNTEEWINDTINEVLDGDIFADKVKEINTKIENGEKISYDKLISDKTYDGLIKEIAKNLYGATDDTSVKKAASYLADFLSSQVSDGVDSATSTLSTFENVFNADSFSDAKEKLLELASAGELTPETLESTEDYNKLLTETGLKADEACKKINECVSASQRLNVTANGLSSLTDLYKQARENGFVEIESIEGLSDAFKDLESYNDFVNIVGSGTYTMDEMQKAFDKLTSEYLMHTKVLDGLTEANKNLYVQQLKNYGVVNAQEIVDNELAHIDYSNTIESYYKASEGSEEWKISQQHLNDLIQNETNATLSDFTNGNYEAQQSLLNESNASYVCRQAILDLQMAQYDFNQTKLTVSDNIKELAKLAASYGLTNSQAQAAAKAMDQVKQMQDAGAGGVGLMYTEEQLADFQQSTYDEINAKLQADFNKILTDGTQFNGGSDYQKELAKNTEKANSEAEKSVEIFDWIETKIKRLQTVISEFGQTASNVFKSLAARSSAYGNQISKVTEEISLQQQAYDAYMQKANSIGLSEEYASKVRNGAMNIDEISDETLKTQISDYQTWYDKAQDCLNTVNDLQEEFASLNIDRLQLSIDKINNKLEKTQTNADKIKARIDDTTRVTKASDYDKLDVNYNQQIKSLSEENKLIAEQQKYVEKDSEKWIELEKNIRDNNTSISDLKKNIKENKVLRIEIKLEAQSNVLDDLEKSYDKIQDKISLRETSGQYVSSKDYDNLNKNISKQITKLKEQNKTYADLQKQVKKGSKDWNDYKDSIDSNNSSIRQLTHSMIENAKTKADLIQTKTDDKVSKIDSADELLNAKIQNTGLYSKKNAYTSSKINNVDKRLSAYNNNVKTFSSKVNSSKNSINNSKANKSFLAKIKTYTKKNKVIPSELITQAVKLGYNNLATQCADYNSYLDSLEAAKITAELYKETSKKEKADLAQEKANNIENYYSNRQNTYNQRATELNNKMDLIQTQGYVISENYYSKLIANEKDNNALLVKERDKLVVQLNKSVANGDIKKGSDEWYAMCQQINNVTNAIDESTKSLVEYQNAMRQLKWDNFDYLEQRISSITDETDFMINQLSRKELASDDIGGLTDEGKAVNSLHIANMTAYKQQSYDYKHEIEKINKELAKDPYNKELINRKDELVQKYQECIDKANQEKYAVIDLYKQGYDALKNKISEVTNEYTSLLDEMKSAYDYSNDIADKTQKIAQLRKQLNAYTSTDMSEETQATVQKLQVSLKNAEKDLKDTQYDRFISDTKDILSDLQDNLSDDIDKILDDLDENFEKVIKENNKISSDAANTIKESMVGIGYTSTENFMTILDSSNFVTGIKETLADIKEYHRKMNEYIKDKEFAEQVTDAIKTTTGVSGNAVTEGMKLIGIPGYAKGSKNIPYDQLAFLAEKGTELQYDTSQGVLRTVGKGDMVFTNDMAKNLWKLAQSNPINFASNLMPTMPDVKSNYTGGDVNISYGDIVMNGVNDPEIFAKQLREEICKNGKTTQCITEAVSSKQMGNGIGKARLYR